MTEDIFIRIRYFDGTPAQIIKFKDAEASLEVLLPYPDSDSPQKSWVRFSFEDGKIRRWWQPWRKRPRFKFFHKEDK